MKTMRLVYVETLSEAIAELTRIGVDEYSLDVMAPKAIGRTIKVENVTSPAANILKQEMLSLGGDAAVARGVITGSVDTTDVLLIGTLKQLKGLVHKITRQPFGLSKVAERLIDVVHRIETPPAYELSCREYTLHLGARTHIMGVLNVTPDSFSDGGQFNEIERAVERAQQMVDEGADIIDVGGESTRPGSAPISPDQELRRSVPVVEHLVKSLNVPISVDTYRSSVAATLLEAGAHMVNDISGLRFDPEMGKIVSRYNVPIILMHMKGRPKDMQKDPSYDDLLTEIVSFLLESAEGALSAGIHRDRILIDPGIGFGKTVTHNLEILKRLREFSSLGYPVLIGASRKSFIGHILDVPVDDRVEGSLAAVAVSILNGAHILRVHDVKPSVRVARLVDAVVRSNNGWPGSEGERKNY
jgi:dihydropteroate synthase